MVKIIKTIYLDLEIINELKKEKVNLSNMINSYLWNYLGLNKNKEEYLDSKESEVFSQ